MSERHKQDWLRDVEERQRNIVFPDTLNNEVRFWRNLQNQRTITSKLGLFVLALFYFGFAGIVIFMILRDPEGKQEIAAIILGTILIFGPIFGAIAWATRRALRNIQQERKVKR